ncbi:MAG TPA: hypothetical protein PKE04_09785 [Clostridia bacterium]|nr:hypothetical protein [Clostridia bacterium]
MKREIAPVRARKGAGQAVADGACRFPFPKLLPKNLRPVLKGQALEALVRKVQLISPVLQPRLEPPQRCGPVRAVQIATDVLDRKAALPQDHDFLEPRHGRFVVIPIPVFQNMRMDHPLLLVIDDGLAGQAARFADFLDLHDIASRQ